MEDMDQEVRHEGIVLKEVEVLVRDSNRYRRDVPQLQKSGLRQHWTFFPFALVEYP